MVLSNSLVACSLHEGARSVRCTMSFQQVNSSFEEWLRERCAAGGCTVVEADLEQKRKNMRKHPFVFLRATFFRWAGRMEALCPDLAGAPAVLSLGDAHIENFGT